MSVDIAGIGTVLVDHVVELTHYPERDTKQHIKQHWFQVGGPVPTALVVASRLGHTTSFLGQWGNDHHGDLIEEDLRKENVDTINSLRAESGRTGFAHIWVEENGTRTIVFARGDFEPPDAAYIHDGVWPTCRLLHLDGWAAEAALEAAHGVSAAGGRVVLDGGSRKSGMEELLPLVDILVASRQLMLDFAGTSDFEKAGAALLKLGPKTVVMTNGDQGACLFGPDQVFHQPAFPVTPVDTTAAGDVFCGALLHGLLKAWKMEEAVQFASAAAALKCSGRGNRDAIPSAEAVRRLIERTQ